MTIITFPEQRNLAPKQKASHRPQTPHRRGRYDANTAYVRLCASVLSRANLGLDHHAPRPILFLQREMRKPCGPPSPGLYTFWGARILSFGAAFLSQDWE